MPQSYNQLEFNKTFILLVLTFLLTPILSYLHSGLIYTNLFNQFFDTSFFYLQVIYEYRDIYVEKANNLFFFSIIPLFFYLTLKNKIPVLLFLSSFLFGIVSHLYHHSTLLIIHTFISFFILIFISFFKPKSFFLFIKFFIFSILLSSLVSIVLFINPLLTPSINDISFLFIDSFYGITKHSNGFFYFDLDLKSQMPTLYFLMQLIYDQLMLFYLLFLFYLLRTPAKEYYIYQFICHSFVGFFLYFLYPVVGPEFIHALLKPAFLKNNLNIITDFFRLNDLSSISLTNTIISSIPRNCVPSIHFSSTLFLFISTIETQKSFLLKFIFFLLFIVTTLTIIFLNYHYITDIFIALPFFMMIKISFNKLLPLKNKAILFSYNFFLLITWYLFLNYSIDFFSYFDNNRYFFKHLMTISLYTLTITSILLGYYTLTKIYFFNALRHHAFMRLIKKQHSVQTNTSVLSILTFIDSIKPKILNNKFTIYSILFIFSGFSALIYQVVFGKHLGLIFGATSLGIYIILASYMIGIGLGTYIAGRMKIDNFGIIFFAICEFFIAIYCLFSPFVFYIADFIYQSLFTYIQFNHNAQTILKLTLGIFALIIPTTFMGLSTPFLINEFSKKEKTSFSTAYLYSLNTLGAALGSLLSSYIILPTLGVSLSITLAAFFNFFVAIVAFYFFKMSESTNHLSLYLKTFFKSFTDSIKSIKSIKFIDTMNFNTTLFALFVAGSMTMVMEVLFVNTLSIVLGNSVYVFGIMLFTFLIGLSAGSLLATQVIKKFKFINTSHLLVLFYFFGALSCLLSFNFLITTPDYLLLVAPNLIPGSFESREFIRFIRAFLVMMLPTFFSGGLYTLLIHKLDENNITKQISIISQGIFFNTLGNIVGIFLGGFFFINILGIKLSFVLLITIFLLMAFIYIQISVIKLLNVCLLILLIFFQPNFDYNKIANGASVYFSDLSSQYGPVIDYLYSVDGGLTAVQQSEQGNKTLTTNGKFQGDDAGEQTAQIALGLTPALQLSPDSFNNALVIGYGTGMTSRIIHDLGFKHLDISDLSQDIVVLANKHFQAQNNLVSQAKNVSFTQSEGRNFLKLSQKKYDLISIEITSIWFAGAANLYNDEFYKIAKSKLSNHGVLQQWVQLHHMNFSNFLVIINTLKNNFKYVNFYVIGGQGILVATNSAESSYLKKDTFDLAYNHLSKDHKFADLKFSLFANNLFLNHQQLNDYLAQYPFYISTDDNLFLEYQTPKGNAIIENTASLILADILKFKQQKLAK